jgi:TonB family protein
MNLSLTAPILALASALAVTGSGQEPAPPKISSADAAKYVGRTATVCGRIVSVECSADDSRLWFTLDGPYPRGTRVAVTRFDRTALGTRVGHFLFQQVCATGSIDKGRTGVFVWGAPDRLLVQEPQAPLPFRFREAHTPCDAGVTGPTVLYRVAPLYTAEAARAKVHGTVLLNAVVLPTGQVGDVVVAASLDKEHGMDGQAVRALRNWRFKPASKDGLPVAVVVSVELTVNIQ